MSEGRGAVEYPRLIFLMVHLVVVFTDGLEDHRGDPADVAVVLDHQVGSAAHQLLAWYNILVIHK